MKAVIVFLLLTAALSAYGTKEAISIDIGPTASSVMMGGWGIGFTYEISFTGNISCAAKIAESSTTNFSMFTPGIEGRWYFSGTELAGLFLALGIDLNFINYSGELLTYPGIGFFFGYKFLSEPWRGPFLEPYAGYDFLIGSYQPLSILPLFDIKFGIRLGYYF